MRVQAVILAGGPATGLGILSEHRSEASVPFAGKYRLIDFTLSNLANSGIYDVAILTQYRPHSLNEHIGSGRPWDLDRGDGGVRLLQPYIGRDNKGWQRGTADSVYQNLRFFDPKADTFLILSGDHIYTMDYRPMLREHDQKDAEVTVAVNTVPLEAAHRYGIVGINAQYRITHFWEKPKEPHGNLASMGVYVFKRRVLERVLGGEGGVRPVDFGREVFPKLLANARAFAYPFLGYFVDAGEIKPYWDAQMSLLTDDPPLDLYNPDWVVHTRSEERAPAKTLPGAVVHHSFVSNGCQIHGTVERSVLSPGVVVEAGAVVRDAIIMTDSTIGADAVVEHAIIDKLVHIGRGARVGGGTAASLALIGKGARVPDGVTVAPKAVVQPGATAA
ncbi:MAG: sugar phosphate nucleotidyltransferase [Anaerolineae bacterium]